MVVQWRAWRDWFERLAPPHNRNQHHHALSFLDSSLPTLSSLIHRLSYSSTSDDDSDAAAIHTGRDFLNLIEAEWVIASSAPSSSPSDPEAYVDVARKRARGTWREAWWMRIPEAPSHGHEKKNWKMFSDHYWLARDMEKEQVEWLMREVPLVNWIRSVHAFVVHAGVLPADPTRKMDDGRQPLARVPQGGTKQGETEEEMVYRPRGQQPLRSSSLSASSVNVTANPDIHALRGLQEAAILTRIPQNTDHWVVLNMRSVENSGKVTRKGDVGTPWSDLWADAMGRCKGYGIPGEDSMLSHEDFLDGEDMVSKKKKYELKCYPSTVVYGHAATRGLDVKRWSFGLDSGCLYGGRLTALVLSRDDSRVSYGLPDEEEAFKAMKFGDAEAHIKAKLVSVKCPNPDEDEV